MQAVVIEVLIERIKRQFATLSQVYVIVTDEIISVTLFRDEMFVMNIYELLKEENQKFWDFLNLENDMFSAQDLAYWEDEEKNRIEELESV